ncbi:MAG: UvrD-helicase domain-containing protein [Spirochaetales bacterium]|nr:UvrD-helicase domain-containing protein [Spirochaetales bacterium]
MSPTVEKLNPEQNTAVNHLHGPLLIFAAAGTGKTRVITHRIQKLIQAGIPPGAIVAVTFTNKAAREMRDRLGKLLPGKNGRRQSGRGMVLATFHSLGNRILRDHICELGYHLPYSIFSADDSLSLLAEIYTEKKMTLENLKEDRIQTLISFYKNSEEPRETFAEKQTRVPADFFLEVLTAYEEKLKYLNAVDFDDLIRLPVRLLRDFPGILQGYRKRWSHFLVDEFQDTNPIQYNFIKTLSADKKNICVVGDDDQSIYAWRGADLNIILGFHRDYPEAQVVKLERNYRSTARILEAASHVIANNVERAPKVLKATGLAGELIKLYAAPDEVQEAIYVSDTIKTSLIRRRRKPEDFAILFRTNFQSRLFEQELRKRNIPLHVVGGYKFFERREIRDLIAYLRLLANPRDELSLLRIINRPVRGIGEKTIARMQSLREGETSRSLFDSLALIVSEPGLLPGLKKEAMAELVEFLNLIEEERKNFTKNKVSASIQGLIKRLDFRRQFLRDGDEESAVRARELNLQELVNMAAYMEQDAQGEEVSLFDFLGRISLLTADDDDAPGGRVQLITVHQSKGLEFPVVFVAGLEEGTFPSRRSVEESEAGLAEERRLFYVALTRAREDLYLSYCLSRRRAGALVECEVGRLLSEVPTHLLDVIHAEGSEESPPLSLADRLSASRLD